MTILGTEVVDRQTDLVAIDSVNPGLSPGGAGEAEIARYVRDWAQMQGLRVELVDAIVKTGPVLVALQELGRTLAGRAHALLGPGVVHAGLISGGQETSTIPERCVLTVERRTLPGETVDDEWVSLADTVEWMREAGLAVRVDRIGNVYAERAGDDPALPCVLMAATSTPSPRAARGRYGQLRGTVGNLTLSPAQTNVIPSEAVLTVDLRNPDDDLMTAAEKHLAEFVDDLQRRHGITATWERMAKTAMMPFHKDIHAVIATTADDLGLPYVRAMSGAGHDAQEIAFGRDLQR